MNVELMINNLWVLLGGMLVFVMHLGFAMVEAGLCQAKNCTNILFKNTMVPAVGFLSYAVLGFGLMYPGTQWLLGDYLGFAGFWLNPPEVLPADAAYTYWTDFFFQGMFAATAATIVSGAVAGRVKLHSFMLFTLFYVALVYPLIGSWGWGGGFLNRIGFHDFAGSTFVHSIGGWGALAGVLLLGPRIGKYVDGRPRPIMGHSMPLATIGVFLLWFGWFGFNGGSVLKADPQAISLVLVNTMLGACAGIMTAMLTSMSLFKKPDLSMTLNGCLAGLVGITAGADCFSPLGTIVVGGIAGSLVVFSVLFYDRFWMDDPVGALSVHLTCGIWGTLAVGIFSTDPSHKFLIQLTGVLAAGLVAFPAAFLIFFALKKTIGIRVSERAELCGLDQSEHGQEAYPGFQVFSNQ